MKGGRAGPTFHEAGGRGGYMRGAKWTTLIKIRSSTPSTRQWAVPVFRAIVADRGYTRLFALAASDGPNLDIKVTPATPMLPRAKAGGKRRKGKRVFTPLRPLYRVENAVARLGKWRRLSRRHEQTAVGAQPWLEVACVAYLGGRLRVEPTRPDPTYTVSEPVSHASSRARNEGAAGMSS